MRKYRHKIKKYKHKKASKRFFWFGFFFGVILASAFYFFIFSPAFQIKEIRVSGNIKVPVEELKNTIGQQIEKKIIFFSSKSIFLTDLGNTKEIILKSLPRVAKITLERKFPNVLAAQIEEREPVAIFCQDQDCFFIDREGVIFDLVRNDISNGAEGPPMLKIKKSEPSILELGKGVVDKEKITQILTINSKSAILFEEILVVSERRFDAKTLEGFEIYFNPQRDLGWQLEKLKILLIEKIPPENRRNLKYIDLRFDKIYIYPEDYSM